MESVEARLQRLEDIEAIRQLKARYFHACDQKDVPVIRDCFGAGEILIDYGAIGRFTRREDFIAVFQQMACHSSVIDMHHGQNAQIQWHSVDSASAMWDLYFFQMNTETSVLTQLAGHYEDRYARQEGDWVIVETLFRVTSSLILQHESGALTLLHMGSSVPQSEGTSE